jgi:hypothetical protein
MPLVSMLLGTLILMSVAFYNGYPLVDGDTGSYIYLAFRFMMPPDRAPFYGSFLGIAGLWNTLWLPLFVQNFILSWLIYQLLRLWLRRDIDNYFFLTIIISGALFTHMAWVSDMLMPDAFTGMLALAVLCYFLSILKDSKGVPFLVLIVFFTIMHNSHYLIMFVFSSACMVYAIVRKRTYRLGAVRLFVVSCSALLFICTLNLVFTKTFTTAKGSSAFLVAKLGEMGILNTYLDDNCGKKNYKLCNYKDDIPSAAWEFLWVSGSPFYKTGGWDGNREEYQQIVLDVFTTPKYMGMFIGKSLVATSRQLTQNFVSYDPQGYNTAPWKAINEHYFHELKEYFYSNQNLSQLRQPSFINYLCLLFFVVSTINVLLMPSTQYLPPFQFLYRLIILFVVCNAFITGSFANILARLEVRAFWVLPLFNFIILFTYYTQKQRNRG